MFITSNSCSIRWSCRRSSPPLTRKGYSCSSLPRIVMRFGFLKDSITLILEKDRKKQNICDRRLSLTGSSLTLSISVTSGWHNQVAQLLLQKQTHTCRPSLMCCKMRTQAAALLLSNSSHGIWTQIYTIKDFESNKIIPFHQIQRFLHGTLALASLFHHTDLKW